MYPTNQRMQSSGPASGAAGVAFADMVAAIKTNVDGMAALKDSIDKQAKVGEEQSKVAKANPFGGARGGPGGGQGSEPSGVSGGASGGAGVGIAMAAVAGFTSALKQATSAMEIAGNSTLTSAQKTEKLARSIPVVGNVIGAIIDFQSALSGAADKIRRAERKFARDAFVREKSQEARDHQNRGQSRVDTASNQSSAMSRVKQTGEGSYDHYSIAGGRGYEEEQRLNPAKDRMYMAEARAAGSAKDVISARNDVATKEGALRSADSKKQEADNKFHGENNLKVEGESSKDRAARLTTSGRSAMTAGAEAIRAENELIEAKNRLEAKTVQNARDESQARKENIAVMREELANAQSRTQAAAGQASRIGNMSEADRWQGLHAARLVKERGVGGVTPEILSRAKSVAPDFVERQAQKFGKDHEVAKALRNEGIDGVDKDGKPIELDKAREEEKKVRADVKIAINLDEEALANKIAEAVKSSFEGILKSIKAKLGKDTDSRDIGDIIKNASQ